MLTLIFFLFISTTNSWTCTNLPPSTWFEGTKQYLNGEPTAKYFCIPNGLLSTSEHVLCTTHYETKSFPNSFLQYGSSNSNPQMFPVPYNSAGTYYQFLLPKQSICTCAQLLPSLGVQSQALNGMAVLVSGAQDGNALSFRYDIYSMKVDLQPINEWLRFRVGRIGFDEWPNGVDHYIATNSTPQRYIQGSISTFFVRLVAENYNTTTLNEFSFYYGVRSRTSSCLGFLNNTNPTLQQTMYLPTEHAIPSDGSVLQINVSILFPYLNSTSQVVFGVFRKHALSAASIAGQSLFVDVSYCLSTSTTSCAVNQNGVIRYNSQMDTVITNENSAQSVSSSATSMSSDITKCLSILCCLFACVFIIFDSDNHQEMFLSLFICYIIIFTVSTFSGVAVDASAAMSSHVTVVDVTSPYYEIENSYRGRINSADPSQLMDVHTKMIHLMLTLAGNSASVGDNLQHVYYTGLNTGVVQRNYLRYHQHASVTTVEPDLKLFSFYMSLVKDTAASTIEKSEESRHSVLYGNPFALFRTLVQKGRKFPIVIQDMFDGDGRNGSLVDVYSFDAKQTFLLSQTRMIVRHLYDCSTSMAMKVAQDYKTTFNARVLLLTLPKLHVHQQHLIVVYSPMVVVDGLFSPISCTELKAMHNFPMIGAGTTCKDI